MIVYRRHSGSTHVISKAIIRAGAVACLLVGAVAAAQAQQRPEASHATCLEELDWVEDWASRNYSGYEDKVARRKAAHAALLAGARSDAASATDENACNDVLRRWVAFFEDGHLSFGRPRAQAAGVTQQAPSPIDIRARFAGWPTLDVDETSALARLEAADGIDPVEGIWESADASYRVAVLPSADDSGFVMTVLRADSIWWMPGQVKAYLAREGDEYRTRFFMRDHSEQRWVGTVRGNVLRFQNGSTWLRERPREAGDPSPAEYRAMLNTRFDARELRPGTVLVNVPTFNDARGIDSLFAVHGKLIRGAERLILDVRGNGGGSDYNFRMLTPLLYTGPVRLISNMVLATEDNNRANAALAADTTIPEGQRRQIREALDRVRRAGQRWYAYDDRVLREPAVLRNPRSVAVIIDRGCASSCEQFVLVALQSSKTRIYGTNSAGINDYGNVREARMPNSTLTLWHPTTRTRRIDVGQGIDGTGIPPHEHIPADVVDQVGWVLSRMN
jgi:hypothetical protein